MQFMHPQIVANKVFRPSTITYPVRQQSREPGYETLFR